ncbi:FtsX-like permease family protein [Streptomyces sp. I05A-00742]|uniref:FtsX-like permease family protein n=1 Tax=Streptomyces sp. I05A-00742 TaxID=2732853 RepID=UPI001BB13217|nr:FtsX-like permease family protein [Streptomyces sp. I05A-00742]
MIGKLALRSLRHRTGGFLATFLALFIGATIVMACGGLMETGIRNKVPPQRLAGAQILVTGDRIHHQPGKKKQLVLAERVELPAALTGEVEAVPGVRTAVGERTFDVALPDGGGTAQAHAWESAALTPYAFAEGGAPRRGEVVLDAALARSAHVKAGDRVRVAAHGGAAEYRVSGVARPAAGREVPQRTLFFSAPDADRLAAHPGTVAGIAVVTERGADVDAVRKGVEAALDGQPVSLLTGDDRGAVEHPEAVEGAEGMVAISGVFGGLGVTVAMFVVAGTVGLSAQQRFRELALLRAVGTTTGQVRRMLLGETLAVAALAGAAAWPAGPALGRWLFERMAATGLIPETVEFSQGWIPAMPAYGSLLLTSVVGTLVGTLRAVRTKPVEALGEAAVRQSWFHPVRLGLGLLFLAGATALALVTALVLRGPVAASTAGPTVMCCVIGLSLLGPWFARLVSVLLHWPVRLLTGASGRLAALNCRSSAIRTAAVATPVMLATAITTGMLYLQTSVAAATDREFTENLRADAVITSAAGGVDPSLVTAVRRLPGVAGASASVTSTAYTEHPHDGGENKRGTTLQGVDAEGAEQVLATRPTAGRLADLKGNTIALPEAAARRMHRGIGDTVGLRMGDGASVKVRIVALFPAREGFETALTSAGLLARHTTAGLPSQILVKAAPGIPAERLMDELDRLAARHPGLKVSDRDAVNAQREENTRTQMWANYLIVGMLVAYTTLSVINSTVVSVGNRRREFALLRLTGTTKGQVLRMMSVESLYVTAVGLILGTAAAATTLVPFNLSVSDTCLPSGPLSIYLTVVAAAGVVTLASTLVPTWAALRARPVEAAKA